jgi:GT2 family glycosyltransferase
MTTQLAQGNQALREQNYPQAITAYIQALITSPQLSTTVVQNITLAQKKLNQQRAANQSKQQVAVCGWELSHNAAGRVYTLAKLYETFAEVEIIGSIFPQFGNKVWEPIRNTTIPLHSFLVEDESLFLEQAFKLVLGHPYDVVHLSKPRIPTIFIGLLYKLIWDAKVLVDIDDEELAFVGVDTPITIDDYLKDKGSLPKLKDLAGVDWTRIAVGLVKEFDGVTVSNPALQQRYGGEIIRHARDEKFYNPSPELTRQSREKWGVPFDKKVVLFCGTPREHKGLSETAQAISALGRDDVVFAIVGDFADLSLKASLEAMAGVDYCFIGNQPFDTLPEVVAIGDLCVLWQDPQSPVSAFQVPAKLSDALLMDLQIITNIPIKVIGCDMERRIVFSNNITTEIMSIFNDFSNIKKNLHNNFITKFTLTENSKKLNKFIFSIKGNNLRENFFNKIFSGISSFYPYEKMINNWKKALLRKKISVTDVGQIDIVIPVFNALDDVKLCLTSVIKKTDSFKVNIFIVNDGSDNNTRNWLLGFSKKYNNSVCLLEHSNNKGYTKAVNTGLKATFSPYVITLNSDTIVSNGWLKGLIRCINSNPKIGIVGPLSNAASWQNVPELLNKSGDFLINLLPENMTVDDMAEIVVNQSEHIYPRLPFINGFCFMIKRDVLNKIGYMDDKTFPLGYGEENDFCIRAMNVGYELAVADDSYVFHAKSRSFGNIKKQELSKKSSKKIREKYTNKKIDELISRVKITKPLDEIRKKIQIAVQERENVFLSNSLSVKLLFLLPVQGGGGGAHSVVQETLAMRRIGVDARIAVKKIDLQKYKTNYPKVCDKDTIFMGFDKTNLINYAENFDVVIATVFHSIQLLKTIIEVHQHILPAYYIQDYEPLFFEKIQIIGLLHLNLILIFKK